MDEAMKQSIWRQFGATIDMLDNAVRACPDNLWSAPLWGAQSDHTAYSEFWYLVYHTLFWLDLYLSGAVEGFAPPAPFTLDELRADAPPPPRYSKEQLLAYLAQTRRKCKTTIETLSDARARERCKFGWGELSFMELQLYNMRHVQEHAAQLNLLLGQQLGSAPDWVTVAR